MSFVAEPDFGVKYLFKSSLKCFSDHSNIRFNHHFRRWAPVYLICSSILYEISASMIMRVISDFYLSISSRNSTLFIACVIRSTVVVSVVSVMKSLASYFSEKSALQWRVDIVGSLHQIYFDKNNAYEIVYGLSTICLENPEQRITQDVDKFTNIAASVLSKLVTVPGVIIYYTMYLNIEFSWVAPTVCYAYFVIGLLTSSACMKAVTKLSYLQEFFEGELRDKHFQLKANVESITLLGGQRSEKERIDSVFNALVGNSNSLIQRRFLLYFISNWFSYFGSVVNYAAVGAALVFHELAGATAPGPHTSEAEMAARVSKGSFACLYLISAFSTFIQCLECLSEMKGYWHRIREVLSVDRGGGGGHTAAPEACAVAKSSPATETAEDSQHKDLGEPACFSAVSRGDWQGFQAQNRSRGPRAGSDSRKAKNRRKRASALQRFVKILPRSCRSRDFDNYVLLENGPEGGGGNEASSGSTAENLTGSPSSLFSVPLGMRAQFPVYAPISGSTSSSLHDFSHSITEQDILSSVAPTVTLGNDHGGSLGQPEGGGEVLLRVESVCIYHPCSNIKKGNFGKISRRRNWFGRGGRWKPTKDEEFGARRTHDGNERVATGLIGRPDGEGSVAVLVPSVTFIVTKGMKLLVRGRSGCGKSSLLRILGGLWPILQPAEPCDELYSSKIPMTQSVTYYARKGSVVLLPQRPYLFQGSILENVLYPSAAAPFDQSEKVVVGADTNPSDRSKASKILAMIGWKRSVDIEKKADWDRALSGGERQLIGIARALFQEPALLILDESTSALDIETESTVFAAICVLCPTIITTGHKESLKKYHSHVVSLDNWSEIHGIISVARESC